MKSSTSWPPSSRKYSAIVSPVRPTRRRAPGGSFIWPYTSAVLSITPDSVISIQRSLPSRVRSPTPANTESPPCCGRDVVDQLLDQHRLADAGASEEADLAALDVRREEIDDLDARLEDLGGRRQLIERRGCAVDRPARGVGDAAVLLLVDRLSEDVEDAAERLLADRNRDRRAGVVRDGTTREPVRRVHRDGAHAVVAQVLLHLRGQHAGLAAITGQRDLQGVVDSRDRPREDGVEDDALDRDDLSGGALVGHVRCSSVGQRDAWAPRRTNSTRLKPPPRPLHGNWSRLAPLADAIRPVTNGQRSWGLPEWITGGTAGTGASLIATTTRPGGVHCWCVLPEPSVPAKTPAATAATARPTAAKVRVRPRRRGAAACGGNTSCRSGRAGSAVRTRRTSDSASAAHSLQAAHSATWERRAARSVSVASPSTAAEIQTRTAWHFGLSSGGTITVSGSAPRGRCRRSGGQRVHGSLTTRRAESLRAPEW